MERDLRTADTLVADYVKWKAQCDDFAGQQFEEAEENFRKTEAAIIAMGTKLLECERRDVSPVTCHGFRNLIPEVDENNGDTFHRTFEITRWSNGDTTFVVARDYEDGQRHAPLICTFTRPGIRQFLDILRRSLLDPADWGIGVPDGERKEHSENVG